ncbi:unnamed protein product [Linum trigynum]|uniref:Uncharacterized protein n=1 Tax=Linum trigynum TaxID=586398 RepID=A0AAV2DUR3_9ROSI
MFLGKLNLDFSLGFGRSKFEHSSLVPRANRSTMSSNLIFGSGCGVADALEECPMKASIANSNLDFSLVCGGKFSLYGEAS